MNRPRSTRRELLASASALPLLSLTGCSEAPRSSEEEETATTALTGRIETGGKLAGDRSILMAEPNIGPIGKAYHPEDDLHNFEADASGLYGRLSNETGNRLETTLDAALLDLKQTTLLERTLDVGVIESRENVTYEVPYDGDHREIRGYVIDWTAKKDR